MGQANPVDAAGYMCLVIDDAIIKVHRHQKDGSG